MNPITFVAGMIAGAAVLFVAAVMVAMNDRYRARRDEMVADAIRRRERERIAKSLEAIELMPRWIVQQVRDGRIAGDR